MITLNSMCLDCGLLGKSCAGSECQVWTGCVYKRSETREATDGVLEAGAIENDKED